MSTVEESGSGWRFSWGLALAGGAVAVAVTFALLTLGSGFGLLLMKPGETHTGFFTGGAIYFLVAEAFGFAVGGHVAGRLLGPLPETHWQEEVRAAIHGLVVWAVAVVATLLLIAVAGATTAALYGAAKLEPEAARPTAYVVDRLFRPGPAAATANPTAVPPPTEGAANPVDQAARPPQPVIETPAQTSDPVHARAEAARLIDADFAPGGRFDAEERARLIQLVAEQAHVSVSEARLRVAAMESRTTAEMQQKKDEARRAASTASLWLAFTLLFGAFAAMVAAVTARLEDDHQTGWTFFAFHRGWRS